MAHDANARRACGAERTPQLAVTLPNLISHRRGRRDGPELPEKTCLLTSLLPVTQQREADRVSDGDGKGVERQADGRLMDV